MKKNWGWYVTLDKCMVMKTSLRKRDMKIPVFIPTQLSRLQEGHPVSDIFGFCKKNVNSGTRQESFLREYGSI
jgi:hypothetical protein